MRRGMKMIVTAAVATVVGISAANGAIQTYSTATMVGGVGIDHPGFGFFQFDPGLWDTGLDANPRFGNAPAAGGGEFSFSGSDGAFHQQTNTVLGQGFSGRSSDHGAYFLMDYNPAPPDRSFGTFWFGGVGNDEGPYPKVGGADAPESQVLMYVDVVAPAGKPMRFAVESDYNGNNNGRRFNFTGTGTYQTVGGLMSAADAYGNFNKADTQLGVLVSFGQGNEITAVDNGSDPTNMPSVIVDNLTLTVAQSSWTGTTGGNWLDSTKWNNTAPDGANATAIFGTVAGAGAQTINMQFDHFVGTLQLDSASSYTFSGAGTLALRGIASGTFSGNAALNAVSGSHTISVPLDLYSNTTVTVGQAGATVTASNLQPATIGLTKAGPGTFAVNNVRTSSLTVNAGTVSVIANGGNTGTSRVGALTIAGGATPTATLDLKDNDLIVTSGTYAAVTSAIAFARHGGLWDRPGLTSSSAATATPKNKTLGTITGAEFHTAQGAAATFDGFTVANTDLLVKYTYYGDADLNGQVNFDDYSRIDAGFNNARTGWFNGDFDYSGGVDFDDYSLIDNAFNTQSGTLRRAMSYLDGGDRSDQGMNTPALQLVMDHFAQFGQPYANGFLNAVPEPTSALALIGIAAAIKRRRRRH